jgi:hypothetical protein
MVAKRLEKTRQFNFRIWEAREVIRVSFAQFAFSGVVLHNRLDAEWLYLGG